MPTTYEPIATTTLTSPATEINFTSISGNYTDIVFVLAGTSAGNDVRLQFNNNTGSNYSYTRFFGDGSSVYSDRGSNVTDIPATLGGMTNANSIVHINNYSNTTTFKTALVRANNPGSYIGAYIGLWRSTSAITSIRAFVLSGSIQSGSTFTLYGIKAA